MARGPSPLKQVEKKKDRLINLILEWQQNPTRELTNQLLKEIKPILSAGIRTFGRGDNRLLPRAKVIAIESLKKYNPTKGSVENFLFNYLRGLQRISKGYDAPVHIPERKLLEYMDISNAEAELADKLNRKPSLAELADYTGVSIERIKRLYSGRKFTTEGAYQRETEEGQMAGAVAVTQEEQNNRILLEQVYHDLDDVGRVIMEHSYGLFDKPILSGNELAKMLKISPAAVSLRRTSIQRMIDELRKELG